MFTFTLAMIVVNFFIQNRLRQEELIQKTKAELDANLKFIYFYAETHNKDAENYSRITLRGFRNDLEHYLKKTLHNNLDPLPML